MTRFEQIAAAFPLHAQRIAEAVVVWSPATFDLWRNDAPHQYGVGWALCDAFDWSQTVEGFHYWKALAVGAGWMKSDLDVSCPEPCR